MHIAHSTCTSTISLPVVAAVELSTAVYDFDGQEGELSFKVHFQLDSLPCFLNCRSFPYTCTCMYWGKSGPQIYGNYRLFKKRGRGSSSLD